jgi:hypothetical protein
MLPGQVFAAPPGFHGIDTNTVLDDRHCRAARAHGFTFCLRYVSRGERQQANDLHEAEARTILNAGLALMPVQHVARAGWSPTKNLWSAYGRNAALHVREIGFPPGLNVWLDLEGVKSLSSHAAVIDYCNGWIAEVESAGFVCLHRGQSHSHKWRRFSGVFGRGIFGGQVAGFRTFPIAVIS